MAHKKGVGSSKNGRESESKRLGIKLFGGEFAKAGNIIIRQRGTKHHPGENAGIGKDHTIYALIDGIVVFHRTKKDRSYVSIKSLTEKPVKTVTETELTDIETKAQPVEAVVAEAVAAEVATAVEEAGAEVSEAPAKPKRTAKPKEEAAVKSETAASPKVTKPKAPKAQKDAVKE